MSFHSVRNAQKAAWQHVRDSMPRVKASRDAVRHDTHATKAAQARARMPWDRAVTNEAVWGLAHAGLLNTPATAAVVAAAKDWLESWKRGGTAPDGNDEPEDVALYRAVQELVTEVLQIPDEEHLTPTPRSEYGFPENPY